LLGKTKLGLLVDHLLQVVLRDLAQGGRTKLPTGGASKRAGGTCPPQSIRARPCVRLDFKLLFRVYSGKFGSV
jgi:hypothetical protein